MNSAPFVVAILAAQNTARLHESRPYPLRARNHVVATAIASREPGELRRLGALDHR